MRNAAIPRLIQRSGDQPDITVLHPDQVFAPESYPCPVPCLTAGVAFRNYPAASSGFTPLIERYGRYASWGGVMRNAPPPLDHDVTQDVEGGLLFRWRRLALLLLGRSSRTRLLVVDHTGPDRVAVLVLADDHSLQAERELDPLLAVLLLLDAGRLDSGITIRSQFDLGIRCRTQAAVAPRPLGGVLAAVVHDQDVSTCLLFDSVDASDESAHVVGGVLISARHGA